VHEKEEKEEEEEEEKEKKIEMRAYFFPENKIRNVGLKPYSCII
jgi:hypothetical protein